VVRTPSRAALLLRLLGRAWSVRLIVVPFSVVDERSLPQMVLFVNTLPLAVVAVYPSRGIALYLPDDLLPNPNYGVVQARAA
jgi:hypothetical protein